MKRSIAMTLSIALLLPAGTALGQGQQQQQQVIENKEAAEKYNEARTLFLEGKYEEAKVLLMESATLEAGNYLAHFLLGLTLDKLRQPEEAIAQFEAAVKFNPNYFQVYSAMASVYLNTLNDPLKAEESYRKAGEVSESVSRPYWQAFWGLGKINFDQQEWDEALQAFGKVAQYNPTDERAYVLMGRIQVEKGEYDNAMMNFAQASMLKPISYEPFFYQSNVLNRIGQYQQAVEKADEALERLPGFGGALLEKGLGLKGLEKWDEAIKVLEDAAKDPMWSQSANHQIETIKNRDSYVNIPPDTTKIPPIL